MARGARLSKLNELVWSAEAGGGPITIGIDLGDRYSHYCVLASNGDSVTEGRIRTAPEAFARHFQHLAPARIAIEVGGHSRWVSQLLTSWGHEVLVANARMVQLISAGVRKSDQIDAQLLARVARVDPTLLAPITHVGHHQYPDIAQLRARALLVRTRTRLINAVRGIVKTVGVRLPACHSRSFPEKTIALIPSSWPKEPGNPVGRTHAVGNELITSWRAHRSCRCFWPARREAAGEPPPCDRAKHSESLPASLADDALSSQQARHA